MLHSVTEHRRVYAPGSNNKSAAIWEKRIAWILESATFSFQQIAMIKSDMDQERLVAIDCIVHGLLQRFDKLPETNQRRTMRPE